jgi:hypothetical protein
MLLMKYVFCGSDQDFMKSYLVVSMDFTKEN